MCGQPGEETNSDVRKGEEEHKDEGKLAEMMTLKVRQVIAEEMEEMKKIVATSKKPVEEEQEVEKKTDGDIKEVGGPEHSQSGHGYNGKHLIPGTTLYASISRKLAK